MAGMSLRANAVTGVSFTPSMPVAAQSPSAPRTIAEQAYGVQSGGDVGPKTAAYGAVGVGTLALAALIFIWWSLPR